jgi:N-acetylglucosamine-6-phosphate deacetylase
VGASRDIGSLTAGKWADVILIDEDVNVHATYIVGERVLS